MYKRLNGMPLGWFEETHATQEDYEDISIGARIGGGATTPNSRNEWVGPNFCPPTPQLSRAFSVNKQTVHITQLLGTMTPFN